MNYSKDERRYYNQHRNNVCNTLGISDNQYNWLRLKGEELRKLYEDYCNGTIVAQEEYEDRDTRLQHDVYAYLIKQKLNTKAHKM